MIWILICTQLAATDAVLPHVTRVDGLFESRIVVANQSESGAAVDVIAYSDNGGLIAQTRLDLEPLQTYEADPVTLLARDDVASLRVQSVADLAVTMSYRAKSGNGPTAFTAEQGSESYAWRVRIGGGDANWDGIAVVNCGAFSAQVIARVRTLDGDFGSPQVLNASLASGAKALHVLSDSFQDTWVEVLASQPIALIGLSGDLDNRLLWSNPATPTSPAVASVVYQLKDRFPSLEFDSPIGVVFADGNPDSAYVVNQSGLVERVDSGAAGLGKTTVLNLSDRVTFSGEMGLLGMAFHPKFASSGFVYADYTTTQGGPRRSVIARFTGQADGTFDPASEQILLQVEQPFSNHNGGQLAFGGDGYLYIAFGDGGSAGDPQGNAQNRTNLLGSILRIDVDHRDPGLEYAIPPDNPFTALDDLTRWEIFAYGLRNPWRFSFDHGTDPPTLWVADVGQDRFEEVNVVTSGDNCGWNIVEGESCFSPPTDCQTAGLQSPIYVYDHGSGDRSITGGFVYRGERVPSLQGRYLFGDYVSGRIWALLPGESPVRTQLLKMDGGQLASFAIEPNGELLVCLLDGRILTLDWELM